MNTSTLDFPVLTDEVPALPIVASRIDLTKIDLTDVALAQFGSWRTEQADAAKRLENVAWDVTTPKGLTDIKDMRNKVTKLPQAEANKTADALVSKLTQVSKAVRAEQTLIVDGWKKLGAPLTVIIDKRETQLAEEKAERDRIESERKAKHESGIATIRGYVGMAQGLPSERIAKGIAIVEAMTFGAEWEEFAVPAADAQCRTLEALRAMFATTKAREDEAAAAELRRIEQARIDEEQRIEAKRLADLSAELDRQAAALRAAATVETTPLQALVASVEASKQPVTIKDDPAPILQPRIAKDEPAAIETKAGMVNLQAAWALPAITIEHPLTVAAEKPDTRPPITTGMLCDRLRNGLGGNFVLSVEFIEALGFTPAPIPATAKGRSGTYWHESDFVAICAALVQHIGEVANA